MKLLVVDFTDFFGYIFNEVMRLFISYIQLLKQVVIFSDGDITITAFNLRLGVLFLQIFFGIVFILAPRLGGGSVMKGNGI